VPATSLLTVAGVQVPLIPSDDVAGKTGTDSPAQIVCVLPKLNVGFTFAFTVTWIVVGTAQRLATGVNVYAPGTWLLIVAGLHVPGIPFEEMLCNVGGIAFAQMMTEVPKENTGVMFGVMVTVKLAGFAQRPVVGVNV
jgi:hypothetical protein